MEKGFVENGFIIDLSNAKNTTQLVFELSSIMEHPDVKGKNICLKLGSLDLKQSQLLSIKALIESMDASIAFIDTNSEQTEASAVSLGIIVSEVSDNVEPTVTCEPDENLKEEEVVVKTETEEPQEAVTVEENKTVEVHADTFGTDFETLATNEGLIKNEDASKYILLDTGDVLPQGAEENTVNTESLPTLYINQTLRSGQTVSYEGNILIIGDAHPGSEIVATGDITVWGILGGIAHAGSLGNVTAKVRALKLNAIQLRIAGLYARRNDTLNVPYVQKTNEFTPEEAQIEEGKIVIYKKLRRD